MELIAGILFLILSYYTFKYYRLCHRAEIMCKKLYIEYTRVYGEEAKNKLNSYIDKV